MDTLGHGYTPADLRAVIAGEMDHTPRKRLASKTAPEKRSGNLLVDIQEKLRNGKGASYARWATLFDLKQMAQTVAYLQENELLDYDTLAEKASAASARYHAISLAIQGIFHYNDKEYIMSEVPRNACQAEYNLYLQCAG